MHLILIGIAALLILLIVTVFILLVYSGLFQNVDVGAGQPPLDEVVLAYKFARGPYKEAGSLFTEVAKIGPDCKPVGIYYDNPQKKRAHRLRYAVGAVLSEGGQEVDPELKKKFLDEQFKIIHLPRVSNAVRGSFPYISTLSIFIAISKAYPALAAYIQEHKLCAHPFLEVYDGTMIHFMAPLSQQDGFYVPEAHRRRRQPAQISADLSDVSEDDTDGYISEDDLLNPPTPLRDIDSPDDTPSPSKTVPSGDDVFRDSLLDDVSQDSILELSSAGVSVENAPVPAAAPPSGTPSKGETTPKELPVPETAPPTVPKITVQEDVLSPAEPGTKKEDKSETESQGSSGSSFEELKMENEELPPL